MHEPDRETTYLLVVNYYGDPEADCEVPGPDELPKWMGVEKDHGSTWFTFADTAAELLRYWSSDDSGYEPREIINLDTGRATYPIVRYTLGTHVSGYYRPQETSDSSSALPGA